MDNRSALLSTALNLFAARGYDAVGVQEIVDSVGITKPTLYHYFGSKQGLLQSLLDETGRQLTARVSAAAAYQGDLTGSLTHLAQVYFAFAREHPTFYRLQLSLWFSPADSEGFKMVSALAEAQHQPVVDLFARAAQDHGNMRGRQRVYALTFIGMVNTYIGLWLNQLAELDDHLVYRLVHQFEHGIYS